MSNNKRTPLSIARPRGTMNKKHHPLPSTPDSIPASAFHSIPASELLSSQATLDPDFVGASSSPRPHSSSSASDFSESDCVMDNFRMEVVGNLDSKRSSTREVLRRLRENGTKGPGSCIMSTLAPTKVGGYSQPSIEGKKIITANQLVAWESVRLGHRPGVVNYDHASHLCGRSACVARHHVIWESAEDNNRRKGCKKFAWLDAHHLVQLCSHNPPCIGFLEGVAFEDIYELESGVWVFRTELGKGLKWMIPCSWAV